MKIISWEELGSGQGLGLQVAAAIGVFDGLHIGHQDLVQRIRGHEGLASAIVTFAKNPKLILSPSTFHGVLSTLDQKLSLIDSLGVDLCVLIDFSGDFSKLPGRTFLSILCGNGDVRFLAVGSDFHCGHRMDTDAQGIRQFCEERAIGVELLKAVHWAGHPVRSSRIRKAIFEGRLEDAQGMLGRTYAIDLRACETTKSGRLVPRGGQVNPPTGFYEADVLHSTEGAERTTRVVTDLGGDGSWSIPTLGTTGFPISALVGLHIIHRVSRE